MTVRLVCKSCWSVYGLTPQLTKSLIKPDAQCVDARVTKRLGCTGNVDDIYKLVSEWNYSLRNAGCRAKARKVMPVVYILTNECMPDTIKIGITENLEQRIKQLDNTSVALPFECYYAVEVPDASIIEKKMHQGLDDYRIRQNREFFNTSPERAKSLLEIAEVMGGKNVTPNTDIVETPQDQEALDRARKTRKRFNFAMLGLDQGVVLHFSKDSTFTCTVANENQVEFRGEIMSLSRSADLVLQELGYDWGSVHGPAYWCLNGISLHALRLDME